MMRNPNFFKGELKYLILKSLSKEPLHGYMLMKTIETNCMNLWRPTPGALYPALQSLKEDALIEIHEEKKQGRKKKTYKITPEGTIKFSQTSKNIQTMEEMYVKYCKNSEPNQFQPEDKLHLFNLIHQIGSSKENKPYHGTLLEFASISRQGKITKKIEKQFSQAFIEFIKKVKKINETVQKK